VKGSQRKFSAGEPESAHGDKTEEQTPDAMCLQEHKCADETLPIEELCAAGYEGVWHGQKGFNDVPSSGRTGAPLPS